SSSGGGSRSAGRFPTASAGAPGSAERSPSPGRDAASDPDKVLQLQLVHGFEREYPALLWDLPLTPVRRARTFTARFLAACLAARGWPGVSDRTWAGLLIMPRGHRRPVRLE